LMNIAKRGYYEKPRSLRIIYLLLIQVISVVCVNRYLIVWML
jgi:hypothetical protein